MKFFQTKCHYLLANVAWWPPGHSLQRLGQLDRYQLNFFSTSMLVVSSVRNTTTTTTPSTVNIESNWSVHAGDNIYIVIVAVEVIVYVCVLYVYLNPCRTWVVTLARTLSETTSLPSTSWSRRSRGPSTWIMDSGLQSKMCSCISYLVSKNQHFCTTQGARAWQDGRFLQQLHPPRRCSWWCWVVQGRLQDGLSQVDFSWRAIG